MGVKQGIITKKTARNKNKKPKYSFMVNTEISQTKKILKEELLLSPYLEKVCRMRYAERKDLNEIAYETGFSVAKINKDLAKIRHKISKLNNYK